MKPDVLRFPVAAFSRAGWVKGAAVLEELTDASPDDDLSEWQGLVIYDSAGLKYTARRVSRGWPASRWGVWLCRLVNNCIRVDIELDEPFDAPLDELKGRLVKCWGETPGLREAASHGDAIGLSL